ncbi:MAG: elongation factor P, partial [Pirellula sp.]
MATYKTNDLKKGLKVQIDGEPYLLTNVDFFKPG